MSLSLLSEASPVHQPAPGVARPSLAVSATASCHHPPWRCRPLGLQSAGRMWFSSFKSTQYCYSLTGNSLDVTTIIWKCKWMCWMMLQYCQIICVGAKLYKWQPQSTQTRYSRLLLKNCQPNLVLILLNLGNVQIHLDQLNIIEEYNFLRRTWSMSLPPKKDLERIQFSTQ